MGLADQCRRIGSAAEVRIRGANDRECDRGRQYSHRHHHITGTDETVVEIDRLWPAGFYKTARGHNPKRFVFRPVGTGYIDPGWAGKYDITGIVIHFQSGIVCCDGLLG